jgi:hypothetical protein
MAFTRGLYLFVSISINSISIGLTRAAPTRGPSHRRRQVRQVQDEEQDKVQQEVRSWS